MKNIWNTRRPLCRLLSMVMTLALTITLLSGCGAPNVTQDGSGTDIRTGLPQEIQEEVHSKNSQLAAASEQVEETVSRLREQMQQKTVEKAEETVKTLQKQLAELEEQTLDWFAAQEDAGACLSGDTRKTLAKRNRDFEKQLADSRKQAKEILTELEKALESGDEDKAQEQSAFLESLLVEKEAPKTYGESLPGETEVQEPEEEELRAEEETQTEPEVKAAESLSGDELSALLVTEGDTKLTDELKAKAEELGTPLAVYNYLKNNIGYEYYYGSRKSAGGTYEASAGNDLDQASLLIAMLRSLGYPAEYVRGDILLTEEQALSLTGADTFRHAADVLAAAGTPVTRLTRNEEIVYIRMEHVWVRTYVPYTDYRGQEMQAGNLYGLTWIPVLRNMKQWIMSMIRWRSRDFWRKQKPLQPAGMLPGWKTCWSSGRKSCNRRI